MGNDSAAKPPESPLATPRAWDLVAPAYAEQNLEHFSRYAADALQLAELRPEHHVLDVATGPGTIPFLVSPRVRRVDALDFSPVMLKELERRAAAMRATNIFARQGDGQSLPYPDASQDAVFSMFGLIFFPDRARGFSEMRRVLKPGGRALVSSWQPLDRVPILVAVFAALAAELPSLPFGNARGPLSDPAELEREMSAAGFDVEVHALVHAVDAPTLTEFWASLRRTLAPVVLLEDKMGAAKFQPVADGILRRLLDKFGDGPVHAPMPAWLGVGRAR